MESIFRFEGRFDNTAALVLRERVMTKETPRTILDFSHVEIFDDATLPLLTVNLVLLRRKGREVILLGLREHQLRVLHHFGIDVASDGSVELQGQDEMAYNE